MLVVGANLCVDRTLRMERLIPGAVQRPRSAELTAGGKAVNVCRAAQAHGVRARLVANLPGDLGRYVGDLLDREGHDVRRVMTSGVMRSATIILEDDSRVTVLNEPGPALQQVDRKAFLTAVTQEFRGHPVVVMSGSLPPGRDQYLYGEIVERARVAGVVSIVDAAREALVGALAAGADIVTPNLAEAVGVLGGTSLENVEAVDDAPRQALAAAKALHSRGAGAALVTAGRFGVAGASTDGAFWVDAPSVTEVNPIGAGDAFAAGLAVGLAAGERLDVATLRAVASGSAAVTTPLAGEVDRAVFDRLLARLTVQAA